MFLCSVVEKELLGTLRTGPLFLANVGPILNLFYTPCLYALCPSSISTREKSNESQLSKQRNGVFGLRSADSWPVQRLSSQSRRALWPCSWYGHRPRRRGSSRCTVKADQRGYRNFQRDSFRF